MKIILVTGGSEYWLTFCCKFARVRFDGRRTRQFV
jgi:hypothetical protein